MTTPVKTKRAPKANVNPFSCLTKAEWQVLIDCANVACKQEGISIGFAVCPILAKVILAFEEKE